MSYPDSYWDEMYSNNRTGWDIGYISTPLKEYIDQLVDKNIRILIPGAGKAWEAEYLFKLGFKNTFILDYSSTAINEFSARCPDFPSDQIIIGDFFLHKETYDLIVEQTFFSSLFPSQRKDYVRNMCDKLASNGKLVGLLFNHEFSFEGPPFGGSEKEYVDLFSTFFQIEILETATNSIMPRAGREIFMILRKKIAE